MKTQVKRTQADVDAAERQNQQQTSADEDDNAVEPSPDHPATCSTIGGSANRMAALATYPACASFS